MLQIRLPVKCSANWSHILLWQTFPQVAAQVAVPAAVHAIATGAWALASGAASVAGAVAEMVTKT